MAKGGAKKAAAAQAAAIRMLSDDRQARNLYEILETGIELVGTEVKSIHNQELKLHNVHISPRTNARSHIDHDPLRTRKILIAAPLNNHLKELKIRLLQAWQGLHQRIRNTQKNFLLD